MPTTPQASAEAAKAGKSVLDLTGSVLDDRYIIGRRIGVGAMGVVYECTHRNLGRQLAIKILKGEYADHPTYRLRFEREAQSASSIRHPNVVDIVDYGEVPDGPLYMVMEYLAGTDLRQQIVKHGPLSPEVTAKYLAQVLRALTAAHAVGIIHRDIKTANCFITHDVTGDELIKVLDFGVAKIVDDAVGTGSGLTKNSEVIGTAAYIAPELTMGKPAHPGSDIYAVGVLAYEMLTGHGPFEGQDVFEVMTMHVRKTPPPLPDTVPSRLAHVVMRALEKNPDRRFPSAVAMYDALHAAVGPDKLRSKPALVHTPDLAADEEGDDAPTMLHRSNSGGIAIGTGLSDEIPVFDPDAEAPVDPPTRLDGPTKGVGGRKDASTVVLREAGAPDPLTLTGDGPTRGSPSRTESGTTIVPRSVVKSVARTIRSTSDVIPTSDTPVPTSPFDSGPLGASDTRDSRSGLDDPLDFSGEDPYVSHTIAAESSAPHRASNDVGKLLLIVIGFAIGLITVAGVAMWLGARTGGRIVPVTAPAEAQPAEAHPVEAD